MFNKFLLLYFVSSFPSVILAQNGHIEVIPVADWVKVQQTVEVFSSNEEVSIACDGWYGFGFANATVGAGAYNAMGNGRAYDGCAFNDVGVADTAEGYSFERWVYEGPYDGFVEGMISLKGDSRAHSMSGDCRAAAGGFLEYNSPLSYGNLKLDDSAVASEDSFVLDIGFFYKLINVSFPINFSVGHILRHQNLVSGVSDWGAVDDWFKETSTRASVEVWADGWSLNTAEALAYLSLEMSGKVFLCEAQ